MRQSLLPAGPRMTPPPDMARSAMLAAVRGRAGLSGRSASPHRRAPLQNGARASARAASARTDPTAGRTTGRSTARSNGGAAARARVFRRALSLPPRACAVPPQSSPSVLAAAEKPSPYGGREAAGVPLYRAEPAVPAAHKRRSSR